MINRQNHIIKQQHIEVSFQDLDDAFGLQDRIAELFYERIQPKMETLFDELFDKDHIVSIEKLEVDCGILSNKNWEEEWVDSTLRKLKVQLRQAEIKKKTVGDISAEFFFYLQYGNMPWNSRVDSIYQFEQELMITDSFIRSLHQAISNDPTATKRLAYQFSAGFRKKIIQQLKATQGSKAKRITELYKEAEQQSIGQEIIDEAVLTILSAPVGSWEELQELFISKTIKPVEQNKSMEKPASEQNRSKKKEKNSIYVSNAGLIILHPFFPQFFEQLKFIQKSDWVDEQMQHRAALVLEYMATGIEKSEEFNLSLPKIICGMLPGTLITENEYLTDEIKEACEELLRETIHHWAALKNTGTASFRQTFLQRNGKLSAVDDGWLLKVEQQGVDILLGRLPWGIGIIKMLWMKDILYTEW